MGLGGSTGARQWSVEELRIGPVPARQDTIVTADLSGVTVALSRISEDPIVGIIGQDVMKAHQAVIDVAGPTLHLVEPESGRLVGIVTSRDVRFATDPNQRVYELMTREHLVTVPADVTRRSSVDVLVVHTTG